MGGRTDRRAVPANRRPRCLVGPRSMLEESVDKRMPALQERFVVDAAAAFALEEAIDRSSKLLPTARAFRLRCAAWRKTVAMHRDISFIPRHELGEQCGAAEFRLSLRQRRDVASRMTSETLRTNVAPVVGWERFSPELRVWLDGPEVRNFAYGLTGTSLRLHSRSLFALGSAPGARGRYLRRVMNSRVSARKMREKTP